MIVDDALSIVFFRILESFGVIFRGAGELFGVWFGIGIFKSFFGDFNA